MINLSMKYHNNIIQVDIGVLLHSIKYSKCDQAKYIVEILISRKGHNDNTYKQMHHPLSS